MSTTCPFVSVVIPCFNETGTIPRLLAALDKVVGELETAHKPAEVIIVDDGSADGSWAALVAAAGARSWLRPIRFRRNFGQTAAMAAGFKASRGRYIVALDADLQNDPADIQMMLGKLEEGFDVVSGWRRDRQDKAVTRRLPSLIANWLIGAVSGLPLHDYGCTLKAYRREVIEPVRLYGEMHRFIPIYAEWAGARVTEVVVRHHARIEGTSKYGLGRTWKVLLDLLTVKFLGDYGTKPLYLFGGVGFVLCALAVVSGSITLIERFALGIFVHRNPLILLAVMLFVVGIQLMGMGLLAELQVRTYHESQDKPTYIIAEEVNPPSRPSPTAG